MDGSFFQKFFALVVGVHSPFGKFDVVKIDLRVFADNDGPPSPHQIAEHFPDD